MPEILCRAHMFMRAEVDGNRLVGYATVFDQVADTPEGYEAFERSAFDKILGDTDHDAVALWNHNPDHLLGRQSSGTLRMRSTDDGLEFEVDLPDTQLGHDMRVLARRGDLRGASLGYFRGGVRYDKAPDGRTVTVNTAVARVRDVSPVTSPAYKGTNGSISLRAAEFGRVEPMRSQLIRARARVHLGRVKK